MQLDLEAGVLRFWIDGRPLQDMSVSLPPGKAWMPAVRFKEKGLEATLNPYSQTCAPRSTAPLQRILLAADLDSVLVAYNLKAAEDKMLTKEEVVSQIKSSFLE